MIGFPGPTQYMHLSIGMANVQNSPGHSKSELYLCRCHHKLQVGIIRMHPICKVTFTYVLQPTDQTASVPANAIPNSQNRDRNGDRQLGFATQVQVLTVESIIKSSVPHCPGTGYWIGGWSSNCDHARPAARLIVRNVIYTHNKLLGQIRQYNGGMGLNRPPGDRTRRKKGGADPARGPTRPPSLAFSAASMNGRGWG